MDYVMGQDEFDVMLRWLFDVGGSRLGTCIGVLFGQEWSGWGDEVEVSHFHLLTR